MPTLQEFLDRVSKADTEATARLSAASSLAEHTDAVNYFLGRSASERAHLKVWLAELPGPDKPVAGRAYNATFTKLDAIAGDALGRITAQLVAAPAVSDHSMPGRERWHGSVHPVSKVIDEIIEIFREIGFTVQLGPEVEHEWYNFGALNFPPDHPAMDLHDTLYVDRPGLLMRTHTSPVQMRTLQRYAPPVRVLAPGNVYRRDFFDATHAPMFTQLEGLAIDEGVSFADLKATLMHFVKRFYGPGAPVRFGPSYFPFTEPSAQMDVQVDLGDGRGKRWMEIMGCGLVHPAVLENAGIDSHKYSGWAFGMGPARIAMSRHIIPDIRLFYDSDVRFLEQFR